MAKKGRRGGDSSDEEVVTKPIPETKGGKWKKGKGDDVDDVAKGVEKLQVDDSKKSKGKKGRRGDSSDEDEAPPLAPKGGKGGKGESNDAPAPKGGKKGGKKGKRGDDSDSDDNNFSSKGGNGGKKSLLDPLTDEENNSDGEYGNATKASAKSSAKIPPPTAASKKKGKKGKKGKDESSDDDDEGSNFLLAPSGGKNALANAYGSDSDDAKPLAPKKKDKKKASKPAFVAESEEEEAPVVEALPEPTPEPEPEPETVPMASPADANIERPEGAEDVTLDLGLKKKKKKKVATFDFDPDAYEREQAEAAAKAEAEAAAALAKEEAERAARRAEKKKSKVMKASALDALFASGGADENAAGAEEAEEEAPKAAVVHTLTRNAGEPEQEFFGEAEMGGVGSQKEDNSGYTGYNANGDTVGLDGELIHADIAQALVKYIRGENLSNRDRRVVKQYEEDRASRRGPVAGGAMALEGDEHGLSNFSLSQANPVTNATLAAENSKDINIENFTIQAHKKVLFENASLRIAHGRRYGLVGPNGQGKSTILKYMAARELPIPGRIDMLYVEQEVVADDTPAIQAVLKADKKRFALMEEEKYILDTLDQDDANATAGLQCLPEAERSKMEDRLNVVYEELASMKAEVAEASARKILSGLGFTSDMQERPTKHFSGGWRMRISLARALFMQPDLLLLDEPTNHLDLNAVIWLMDYLSNWKTSLLVVSHDQDFLSAVVTDIIHLDQRKLHYYKGDYDDFKAMHAQKVEKQQKDFDKQQKMLQQLKAKGKSSKDADAVAKARAKREGGSKKEKELDAQPKEQDAHLIEKPKEYTVKFTFKNPPPLAPPVLSVSNVNFRYGPKYPYLFEGLNFGIDQQSRVAIVGPNGVGKSTLLNLMIGDLEPTEGDITRNRFLRIGKYSQHFVDVLAMDKTPVEFIMQSHTDQKYGDARAILGRFGLESHAHEIASRNLSGGQKARVVFASLALQAPHIMVLDEPTNNLDIESIDALADAMKIFEGGIVLVSHDARLIRNAECLLWVCDHKTVKPFDGDIDDYRASLLKDIHDKDDHIAEQIARDAAEAQAKRIAELRLRIQARKAATQ